MKRKIYSECISCRSNKPQPILAEVFLGIVFIQKFDLLDIKAFEWLYMPISILF